MSAASGDAGGLHSEAPTPPTPPTPGTKASKETKGGGEGAGRGEMRRREEEWSSVGDAWSRRPVAGESGAETEGEAAKREREGGERERRRGGGGGGGNRGSWMSGERSRGESRLSGEETDGVDEQPTESPDKLSPDSSCQC